MNSRPNLNLLIMTFADGLIWRCQVGVEEVCLAFFTVSNGDTVEPERLCLGTLPIYFQLLLPGLFLVLMLFL